MGSKGYANRKSKFQWGVGFSTYIVLTDGQVFYATLNTEYGREIERINAVLNV